MQIPTTLRPSHRKAVMMFLGSGIFLIGAISKASEGSLFGYIASVVFGLGLVFSVLLFIPNQAFLRLEAESFTFRNLFRTQTVRWATIRDFSVISVGSTRMVAWNLVTRPATGSERATAKLLSVCVTTLPDTYGKKPQELADLMEEFRQNSLKTPSGRRFGSEIIMDRQNNP